MIFQSSSGHLCKEPLLNPHYRNHDWIASYTDLFSSKLELPEIVGLPNSQSCITVQTKSDQQRPGNLLQEYQAFNYENHVLIPNKYDNQKGFSETCYADVLKRVQAENKLILSPCFQVDLNFDGWTKNRTDHFCHQSILTWLYFTQKYDCKNVLILLLPSSLKHIEKIKTYFDKAAALGIKRIAWIHDPNDDDIPLLQAHHFYFMNSQNFSCGLPIVKVPDNKLIRNISDDGSYKLIYFDDFDDSEKNYRDKTKSISIRNVHFELDYDINYIFHLRKVDEILFKRIVTRHNTKILQFLLLKFFLKF